MSSLDRELCMLNTSRCNASPKSLPSSPYRICIVRLLCGKCSSGMDGRQLDAHLRSEAAVAEYYVPEWCKPGEFMSVQDPITGEIPDKGLALWRSSLASVYHHIRDRFAHNHGGDKMRRGSTGAASDCIVVANGSRGSNNAPHFPRCSATRGLELAFLLIGHRGKDFSSNGT